MTNMHVIVHFLVYCSYYARIQWPSLYSRRSIWIFDVAPRLKNAHRCDRQGVWRSALKRFWISSIIQIRNQSLEIRSSCRVSGPLPRWLCECVVCVQ